MFNVRLIRYPSGYQLRMYNKLYKALDVKKQQVDLNDYVYNPFTDSMMKERTDLDVARSYKVSMARTVNKIYYLTRSNKWEWFITLTFDPFKTDAFDYCACSKRLSTWLNNCRKICPDMGYIVIPELHKSGAYHFHGLCYNCDNLGFVDSGKKKKGQIIYNIDGYKFGFTTATRVVNSGAVSKYITKYMSKDLCSVTFGKRRYWASRNLEKAKILDLTVEGSDQKDFKNLFNKDCLHVSRFETPILIAEYYDLEKTDYIEKISNALSSSVDGVLLDVKKIIALCG